MVAATVVHDGYELAGGTGLPGQKWLRLPGATAAHVLAAPLVRLVRRPDRRGARAAAVIDGLALGSALLHLRVWHTRSWHGIPVLAENAEGMAPGWDVAYNAVIYPWALLAAGALIREVSQEDAVWAIGGLAASAGTVVVARRQQRWVDAQASHAPRWWNRGHLGRPLRGPLCRPLGPADTGPEAA